MFSSTSSRGLAPDPTMIDVMVASANNGNGVKEHSVGTAFLHNEFQPESLPAAAALSSSPSLESANQNIPLSSSSHALHSSNLQKRSSQLSRNQSTVSLKPYGNKTLPQTKGTVLLLM